MPVAGPDTRTRYSGTDDRVISEGGDDQRRVCDVKFHQRHQVEMVEVVVREQDAINGREAFQGDPERCDPTRTGEGEGARPIRPHRIGQDVQVPELDQGGGMSHHRHSQGVAARRRHRLRDRQRLRPSRPASRGLPAKNVDQGSIRLHLPRVEEANAVEMVGWSTPEVSVPHQNPRQGCHCPPRIAYGFEGSSSRRHSAPHRNFIHPASVRVAPKPDREHVLPARTLALRNRQSALGYRNLGSGVRSRWNRRSCRSPCVVRAITGQGIRRDSPGGRVVGLKHGSGVRLSV